MTLTRRTWTHPRTDPKTVPQMYALVMAIEISGRLLVVIEGPGLPNGLGDVELLVEGPNGPLDGFLVDGQSDRNGHVLVGEYETSAKLDVVLPVVLRINGEEVLNVRAYRSR